ncbi:hypothetical protein Gpo141_00010180 [Globisporangium polare]
MWSAFLTRSSFFNPRARLKLHVDAPPIVHPITTEPQSPAITTSHNHPQSGAMRGSGSQRVIEPESDAASPSPAYRPGRWDIWILGLSIGLGGQYFSWNDGLRGGLYSFLLIYFLVGFAYIALCCCTSEITGALPFAGGAYGLSRCTLGFYPGFIIGCAETIEYIVYVSSSVLALTNMMIEISPQLAGFEPLLWLFFYASSLYFHVRGDYVFWRWNMFVGVLSLFFVLLYCFGSFPHTDFVVNADNDPDFRFVHGVKGFLRSLPLSCWFFVGVEALNLASDDVLEPTKSIPFAQVSCILALFFTGIVVLFVTVSLPPPGLKQISKLLAPFDNGFQLLFNVSVKTATLLSIPAMYATTFGFMWGYGKLIAAMATSKLLPPVLAQPHPKYGTPYLAVLSGSILGYCVCLLVFYVPSISDKYLFNICIAMAFLGYSSQCIGYIALKRNYPNIKSSSFHSPFGVYGAAYSLIIWLLGLISVACFQESSGLEFFVFLGILAALTVFYFVYAKSRQTLSAQEHKVFLLAHVMKFNKDKSRKKQYSSSQSPNPRGSGSPTRLIAATGLVRPALTLAQLHLGRGGDTNLQQHGSLRPLKLPIAIPLPDATPFHRQFTKPRVKNPYADRDDPHEIRDASRPVSNSAPSLVVDAALTATDGMVLPTPTSSSFTIGSKHFVTAKEEPFSAVHELVEAALSGPGNDDLVSNDVDEHSEIYGDEDRRGGSDQNPSSPDERSTWSALGLRFATFITNVGFVGDSEAEPALKVSEGTKSMNSSQDGELETIGSDRNGSKDHVGERCANIPRGVVVVPQSDPATDE